MPKSFWAKAVTTAAYILNRLPSNLVDGILYELWYNKPLSVIDLKALKPFRYIVHTHIPKKWRKKNSKVDTHSTTRCFIGYTDSNTMHKIWDLEWKCFVNSHDLIFEETQFPKPSDSNEPPVDTYNPRTPSPSPESIPELEDIPPPQIFDEIVVQLPPVLQAFRTYGEF